MPVPSGDVVCDDLCRFDQVEHQITGLGRPLEGLRQLAQPGGHVGGLGPGHDDRNEPSEHQLVLVLGKHALIDVTRMEHVVSVVLGSRLAGDHATIQRRYQHQHVVRLYTTERVI